MPLPTSSEPVIRLDNISKIYRLYERPIDRLAEAVTLGRRQRHRQIRVLSGVNLSIHAGHTVGIVGRNGAGKSTLLRIVAGTTRPTTGRVSIRGSVAALLELGSGFNPEFTGRENVFLNAGIHGLSHEETKARYQQIAEYSELGEFLERPVKTYSSGMAMRLAFATAIHVERDVLIVDESLSVGDAMFARKCMATIESLKQNGATILFVSHSLETVKALCDQAVLLEQGTVMAQGEPIDVLNEYSRLIDGVAGSSAPLRRIAPRGANTATPQKPRPRVVEEAAPAPPADQVALPPSLMVPLELMDVGKDEFPYGTGEAEIDNVRIVDDEGRQSQTWQSGDAVTLSYDVRFDAPAATPHYGMSLTRLDGVRVYGTNTMYRAIPVVAREAGETVRVEFRLSLRLVAGNYYLTVGCVDIRHEKPVFLHRRRDMLVLRVLPAGHATGIVDLNASVHVEGVTRVQSAA
ncbi:MAG: ABC transporter ATP-binding protein [Pirellulales bacterium]|nr:ABC transporter ATP-binding protein [Pirellulales bacterium]